MKTAQPRRQRAQHLCSSRACSAIANGYWDHMSEWTDEAGQQKGRFKIIWCADTCGLQCKSWILSRCATSLAPAVLVPSCSALAVTGFDCLVCGRNEVEVVNVPRFLQADVRDFVDAVNATQNVWTQR